MIKNQKKIEKYEEELCTYIIKLSDKSDWTKNDFHKIYDKLLIFIKKCEIDESSLLNSGYLLLRQSGSIKCIDFENYNDLKLRFRTLIDSLVIPESIAIIAAITKYIITDNKINYNEMKDEVDEI